MWDDNGVWTGGLSEEEWNGGGAWLFGDRLLDGHPGRNASFLYKSWVAMHHRYGGDGHPRAVRTRERQWEFVQVFTGKLDFVARGKREYRFPLMFPESVDLAPAIRGFWQLPIDQRVATGVTVCRCLPRAPAGLRYALRQSWGERYEFRAWEVVDPATGEEYLKAPRALAAWTLQFIEVFSGTIAVEFWSRTTRVYELRQREHLYVRATYPLLKSCVPVHGPARGVTLFADL